MITALVSVLGCVFCFIAGMSVRSRVFIDRDGSSASTPDAVSEAELADARVLIHQIRQDVAALTTAFVSQPDRHVAA